MWSFKQTIFGHSLQPNVLTIYIQQMRGFIVEINERGREKRSASRNFLLATKQMRPQLELHPAYEKGSTDVLNNDSTS